uniref:Carboxylesterase domain-containing protein n=1 Tax=Charistephane fugiens TaxID=140462 RepID=V9PPC6_9METZ|nr:carboxylesterase domain-containing protein [Charistephane fugiens]
MPNQRTVIAFVGIPYAKPPVGNLRFAKPVPDEGWSGRHDASKPGPSCLQNYGEQFPYFFNDQTNFSENCLYLNVFTQSRFIEQTNHPVNPQNRSHSSGWPIIFYIHGGSFSTGDGINRDGSGLTAQGDVVCINQL